MLDLSQWQMGGPSPWVHTLAFDSPLTHTRPISGLCLINAHVHLLLLHGQGLTAKKAQEQGIATARLPLSK